MMNIAVTVNGETVRASVEPGLSLADFLRETCRLTGTHVGCEQGVCGACTVMLDGRTVRSCITLAVAADGKEVRTVEGYADDPAMRTIRTCFNEAHALQCGFCTPGMLAVAYDVVHRLPDADRDRIKMELSGNLCRCTGYVGIVNAIEESLARCRPAEGG